MTTKTTTIRKRAPKFYHEDLLVKRIVMESNSERIILVTQAIRSEYITRIAESREYENASVLWILNEENPMTVDCPFNEFYEAWVTARKNTYLNNAI